MTTTSNVLGLYDAIAATTITIPSTGETIACRNLQAVGNSVEAADLPVRLLMPFSVGQTGQRGQARSVGIAPLHEVSWTVSEVLLYRTAQSGTGVNDYARVLTEYISQWVNIAFTKRAPIPASVLTSWSAEPDMVEYPTLSGRWYYAVNCSLTYTENIVIQP